jgi:hypothetical protein
MSTFWRTPNLNMEENGLDSVMSTILRRPVQDVTIRNWNTKISEKTEHHLHG